jgi:hypothetical protein
LLKKNFVIKNILGLPGNFLLAFLRPFLGLWGKWLERKNLVKMAKQKYRILKAYGAIQAEKKWWIWFVLLMFKV